MSVPGIPQAALNAIADENVRQVLQAVVDGLNVRNGVGGGAASEDAFVTRGELARLTATNPQIRNAIHAHVFESKLFHDLDNRISLIDKPGGRLEIAETGIATETTQRVNADNAIQQTIATQYAAVGNSLALLQNSQTTMANNVAALTTTLQQTQASVGANSAAIAQETQARVAADNTLYAQYTLRVDVNGRVSGFGLASNQNVSDFIVRADRFSIVSPTGNYAALIMTNNTINVFDENGTLRVKIGRLL